ncbi:MAG: hypothetical protein ABSF77_14400 [Spirochaetia bacterium]|jgi:hypothetical protein
MDKFVTAVHRYYLELKESGLKETPRREKFLVLLKELFPASVDEISKYTDGAEKSVGIQGTGNEIIKTGRIDAYFGDLIIEFERSMPSKRDEPKRQLREYCAGLWSIEPVRRSYICMATDGLTWYTWSPFSEKTGRIGPEDVELKERETLILSGDPKSCEDFFLFINRLFFREGQLRPTVESFRKDFGLQSYLFEGVFRELEAAFDGVKAEREIALSYEEWSRYLTYTYGSMATSEALFCKHTYLSVLAKFIVWAALSHEQAAATPASSGLVRTLLAEELAEINGLVVRILGK